MSWNKPANTQRRQKAWNEVQHETDRPLAANLKNEYNMDLYVCSNFVQAKIT
jgi:hypothetical protein